MSCPAYWNRRVKHELSPTYPDTLIIQARAYGIDKRLDSLIVPGVQRADGDPIKAVRRFLAGVSDPASYVVMYHRAGGFSHVRKTN